MEHRMDILGRRPGHEQLRHGAAGIVDPVALAFGHIEHIVSGQRILLAGHLDASLAAPGKQQRLFGGVAGHLRMAPGLNFVLAAAQKLQIGGLGREALAINGLGPV